MARIRTVKPEFFTHPEVVELSLAARLLNLSLFNQADDEGRLYDQPTKIRGQAFGEHDKVKIGPLLDELHDHDRICRYTTNGRACIHVRNFGRHQRVSHPTPSVIPPCALHASSGEIPERLANDSGAAPERLRRSSGGEGNREGNREQGTGKGTLVAAPRRRDVVFEAFCEVTNVDWHDLSKTRRAEVNGMLASIRRSNGDDADEIRRRARNWAWDVAITPEGFTKRWAELGTARTNGRSGNDPRNDLPSARDALGAMDAH